MKVLVALLAVALCYVQAELSKEQIDKTHAMLKECKEKHEVTDEDIATLMQHKVPETESGKCFSACMKKKLGIMDADNKVNMERVKELMEKVKEKIGEKYEPLMKVLETCATAVPAGPNECEVSAQLMECCVREVKKADIKVNFMSLLTA